MTSLLLKPTSNRPELEIPKSPAADFLRHAKAFGGETSSVDVIETHISWVYLTDRFVYKLKKPVRFEFLDFRDIEQRHEACMNEVQLNRRLSPDVYLDVLPITSDARGRLRLGGQGNPIDWVVKMKRLPEERALDCLIQSRRLTTPDVDALAAVLGRFYKRLPPVTLRGDKYLAGIQQHIHANSDELSKPRYGFDCWTLRRLQIAQRRFICLAREALVDRVRDGRIVDGHGDLRPEHIYLTTTPQIIDCVEFSSDFRTIDIADELAFLGMECDRLESEWVGKRILELYCQMNDDRVWPALVDFFKCYRACVRAKVQALRFLQVEGQSEQCLDNCNEYLQLADRYAKRLGPPMVLVVRGLSGTGKSTLAAALSQTFGCDHLQTDVVRQGLFGPATTASAFNEGRYDPANRQQVYDELFRIAAENLSHGSSIVLDGTFLTTELRRRALKIAADQGAVPLLIHCVCPNNLSIERIRERMDTEDSVSEVQPEFLDRQRAEEERDESRWPVCTVETTEGLAVNLPVIYDRLRTMIL